MSTNAEFASGLSSSTAVDPGLVPHRVLYTGAEMPAIGLGTFGSDHAFAAEVAAAVEGAAAVGYRHFDCASVYGNERHIGYALGQVLASGVKREQLWITSKLWNDKHGETDVIPSCRQSLADLKLEYLDLYLVHWPFPNYHPPGCDVSSRSKDAKPYLHADFMKTWRKMEELVTLGLVRHIGTSNMTVPKLKLVLRDARIKPAVNEMELHPHFQQPELFSFVRANGVVPVGYCPIGSPGRPERDRTPDDSVPTQDPVIIRIANRVGVHPAVVCVKWAIQRGQVPIPFSTNRSHYLSNLEGAVSQPLTEADMRAISAIDRNCRLIKGQVFLWKDGQSWEDLWDVNGEITPPDSRTLRKVEQVAVNEESMRAAFLPGNDQVELRTLPVPQPRHGEVLLRVKASTICGSDIRCIYHEHLGKGPEGYQGVIAGHEPSGQIVQIGPGCRRFSVGDRVVVYHISGCGVCNDCRRGYMISCTSEKYRRAYGWQRDGGMADYMIAEEKDLIALPDELSYADGAQVACGFGTVYEAIEKIGVNGNHSVLITGLGPVGLAAAALCRKMGAHTIIGIDVVAERLRLAESLKLCDFALDAGSNNVTQVRDLTHGFGVERAIDCSANATARATAIRATRKWGKITFVGEGGTVEFNPSPDIIHDQKTIYGSWVTTTWLMEELVERLVRWNLHPADIITHRFPLEVAAEAYALMASGKCGKVAVCSDEELTLK